MTRVWDDPAVALGMARQNDLLASRLDAGDTLIGWKVGLGSPSAMASLGIGAPLVGFLTSRGVLASAPTLSLDGWVKPACEPEIAIHVRSDLGPGCSLDDARASVGGLGAAIELVDVDAPPTDVTAVLAGDIFQRHVILGPPDPTRAGADVRGIDVQVRNHGELIESTSSPEENTGSLLDLVVHVATWVGQMGRRLEAGQVIIAGSVTPIVWVQAGDDIEYACDPIGRLSVSFR